MTESRKPFDERSEPAGLAGGAGGKALRGRDVVSLIHRWTPAILVAAAIMTLVGLALMVWSMAQPTPMPVILAMSVGQGLGIFAFLLFGIVVLIDQLHKQREAGLRAAAMSNGIPAAAPGEASARAAAPSREASP